jgi:hypothetical protein
MPLVSNYSLRILREEFEKIGIYLIEEFDDGQTRWGTEPISEPYGGSSCMASEYKNGRYDIFTVRAIANRLDRAGHMERIEENLFARANEDPWDGEDRRSPREKA